MVLLDVKLPDADGLDLLPQIKKHWPDTEVIVLTGASDDEAVAVEATKRGAYQFPPQEAVRHRETAGHVQNARWSTSSRTRRTAPCAARCQP